MITFLYIQTLAVFALCGLIGVIDLTIRSIKVVSS